MEDAARLRFGNGGLPAPATQSRGFSPWSPAPCPWSLLRAAAPIFNSTAPWRATVVS